MSIFYGNWRLPGASMQILCLGTTGYHPSESRHTACYFLPEIGVLLDAGTGLFRLTELLRRRPIGELDILLSHAHLDHVIGLTFLLDIMATTELQTVRVHGSKEKLMVVRDHLFHPMLFPVAPQFSFHEFPTETQSIDLPGARLQYFDLEHPGGSVGMVLETPTKKIAYITDTRPLSIIQWESRLEGLDLLMHECYFTDQSQDLALQSGHCWLSAVTELVEAIRPKKTLLIHANPQAEIIGHSLTLELRHQRLGISIAEDMMVVEF
jgi:ribonuclease Z